TFAVVEAGDFLRLAAERDFYGSDEYTVALEDVRKRFYSFLADLDKALSESGRRYRVCAVSLEQAGQPNALLPVLIVGSDIKEPCLLTSQSTKRPGIIACADLTQDIFAFFGISCPTSGFAPEPCPGDAETLSKQANQMLLTYKARPTVVVIFVVLTGICAISLLVCLIFYRRLPRRAKDLFRALTIAVMLVPLAIFISPALNIYSLPKTGLFYIAFALAGSLLLRRLSAEKLILTVCSAVSLIILADTFTGSFLSKHSLLSYDPMVGARFYGLGNEYAGILMACSMLTIYLLWQRFSGCRFFAVPVILASLLVIAAIGMPSAGTNFGGMLAAILGFACAFALSRSLKPGAKTVIAAVVCILLLIPAMIFLNVHAPQSHIGRFFSTALQGDSALVLSTVTRKLAMNISLMQASRWVWALISCLVCLIAILFNPRGLSKKLFDTRKKLNAGFCGLIFGLAVGFAVNDSGVVMMATGIMYLTFALALLLLKTAEEEQAGP
ncbi:MAG: hypothetical protein ILO36_06905, partial [Abditibacteriota bacterium]|nr:hypothetical protein [Abditibacteriota bacterium]